MFKQLALALTAFLTMSAHALAQVPDDTEQRGSTQIDELFAALALPEMIDIMAEEGTAYGRQIAQDLIPGGISADWTEVVGVIYDTHRMEAEIRAGFHDALTEVDVAPMLEFFLAEPGQTIIALEVSARRALLDDAVEVASKEMAAIAIADETPRFKLIKEFVQVNDLIETNIVGALNANFAFYTGLTTGGAFSQSLTEDQILADVWGQEPQIRQNTTEWVYSFLLMAYQPLSDAELENYTTFSASEPGKALNKAIFAAFDGMFENISYALGAAAAEQMMTQEL